jgi:hypothetical protein
LVIGRKKSSRWLRPIVVFLSLAFLLVIGLVVRHILVFRDSYVMLTVEESSTGALSMWPLLGEGIPTAYLDCAQRVLQVPNRVNLTGVSLCVYRSATSQGILFSDSIAFSRLGSGRVDLDLSASVPTRDFQGREVDALDSAARVLRGDLKVRKTLPDGTVHLDYGGNQITLKPGESWAELLVSTPDGVYEIQAHEWAEKLNEAWANGWPATRLALCNYGLWPKGGVEEAVLP